MRTFPLFHILHLHIAQYYASLCIFRMRFLAEMHIQITFGPCCLVIDLTIPRGIAIITIEVIIHIRYHILLKLHIDREAAYRLRNGINTIAESRTDHLGVYHLQRSHGMCPRDDHICWKEFTAGSLHPDCMGIVTDDGVYLTVS